MDALTPATVNPAAGLRATIYTRDADSAGVVRQGLTGFGLGEITFKEEDISAAIRDLGVSPSPRLLVVDITGESDPATKVRALIDMCDPSCSVMVLGEANDIRLYRNIIGAGATEYFFKPLVSEMVARALNSALMGTDAAPTNRTGRLVFVLGVRAGCGATTIATRLAVHLSVRPPRPVLFLDLDLQNGDAALQLDATPNHTLTEALNQSERVDELFLERGLIHVSNRLDLLASLEPLHAPIGFTDESLLSLLEKVRAKYRYLVMDTPALLGSMLSSTLHIPNTLLLVSDGRLVSARDVSRWRQWLGGQTAERKLVHVLNMDGGPGSLSEDDFAKAAGQAPDVLIPFSREVANASLLGLKAQPDCPTLDRGLEPILRILGGEAPRPKSRFLGLFGK